MAVGVISALLKELNVLIHEPDFSHTPELPVETLAREHLRKAKQELLVARDKYRAAEQLKGMK